MAAALSRLSELGYLDDVEFARRLVGRRGSTRGAAAIRAELQAVGVAAEVISQVLAELDPEAELRAAEALAAKAFDSDRSVPRVFRRLRARGFSSSVATRVCRRLEAGLTRA